MKHMQIFILEFPTIIVHGGTMNLHDIINKQLLILENDDKTTDKVQIDVKKEDEENEERYFITIYYYTNI
jgi:hypothetical protein